MNKTKKLLSIGGYYGGKSQSVSRILPHLPICSTLVSPFCGFVSVELNSPAKRLILNDANPATVAALRDIERDVEPLLLRLACKRTWTFGMFEVIRGELEYYGDIPGVWAIAYSAMAFHRGGSVSGYSSQQAARAAKRDWGYLRQVSDRLQSATILSKDFRHCFSADFVAALPADSAYYLDPPYLDGGEHYQTTMGLSDHEDMLEMAISSPYPVAISGYASELYDRRLRDWKRVEFPAQNNHRQKRIEVLWVKK